MNDYTLKHWMEVVNYRITEGGEFGWKETFGPHAYRLDSWIPDQCSMSVVFDTEDQFVYMVEAFDYNNDRAYRWIAPDYRNSHDKSVRERGVSDEAWEDDDGNPIKFGDTDSVEDWEDKANAIINNEPYDERVVVNVELPNDLILKLSLMAHEQEITLNELMMRAIEAAADRILHNKTSDE